MEMEKMMALLSEVPDPGKPQKKYPLSHVLIVALAAILAGCQDFCQIAQFGAIRADIFTTAFGIDSIPSHDTFNRVFSLIKPKHFQEVFRQAVGLRIKLEKLGLEHVALDGKYHKGSNTTTATAWRANHGLALGSCETGPAKHNELEGMESLIESLSLAGCVATTDAMGANERIAAAVKKQKGDCVLALKGNQGNAFEWARLWFEDHQKTPGWTQAPTKERHGLCERECFALPNIKQAAGPLELKFTGVESIAMLRKTITRPDGKVDVERRYYLASACDPKLIAESVRAHWGVESGLHWQLGVRFKEDGDKPRDKNAQQNLMLVRKMALRHARSRKKTTFSSCLFALMTDSAFFAQGIQELLIA